jgi:hypothetical protein
MEFSDTVGDSVVFTSKKIIQIIQMYHEIGNHGLITATIYMTNNKVQYLAKKSQSSFDRRCAMLLDLY